MILHITGNPIVFTESFRHALAMMRHGGYACTRLGVTGVLRWACFSADLGL